MIIRDTELNIRQNHTFSLEDFCIVLPIKIFELVKSKKKSEKNLSGASQKIGPIL